MMVAGVDECGRCGRWVAPGCECPACRPRLKAGMWRPAPESSDPPPAGPPVIARAPRWAGGRDALPVTEADWRLEYPVRGRTPDTAARVRLYKPAGLKVIVLTALGASSIQRPELAYRMAWSLCAYPHGVSFLEHTAAGFRRVTFASDGDDFEIRDCLDLLCAEFVAPQYAALAGDVGSVLAGLKDRCLA